VIIDNVAQFKCIKRTNNSFLMDEEINRRLNSGNACKCSSSEPLVFISAV
jgi:hypothetical protein